MELLFKLGIEVLYIEMNETLFLREDMLHIIALYINDLNVYEIQ